MYLYLFYFNILQYHMRLIAENNNFPHEYRVHRHAPQRRQGFWLAAAKPVEMARYCPSLLLRRRRLIAAPSLLRLLIRRPFASSPSNPPPPSAANPASSKPPALSARLSFVFDQLDALDRSRSSDLSARDAALRRIQSWRRPPAPAPVAPLLEQDSLPVPGRELYEPKKETEIVSPAPADEVERMSMEEVLRREVELVHPWPEWIELMERLAQQKYFDLGQAGGVDEASVATVVPMDLSEVSEEVGFDFSRDWTTVKNACMNFGRDRFDILK
jgi:hypothetical protein